MQTLKVAVNGLDDLNALVVVLQRLAERHIKYGVEPKDYTPVGNALLFALKTGLGDDWNPELREAWVTVYRVIATVMKEHAYK